MTDLGKLEDVEIVGYGEEYEEEPYHGEVEIIFYGEDEIANISFRDVRPYDDGKIPIFEFAEEIKNKKDEILDAINVNRADKIKEVL